MAIGIQFPFKDDDVKFNYLKLNDTTIEEVKTNLRHLFTTRRNTRYRNPDFGTGLFDYLFDPNDQNTYEDLLEEITRAVSRYLPGVNVSSIEFEPIGLYQVNCLCNFTINDGLIFREETLDVIISV